MLRSPTKDFKPSSFSIRSRNDDSSLSPLPVGERILALVKSSSSLPTQPCRIASSVLMSSVVLFQAITASQLVLKALQAARGLAISSAILVGYKLSHLSIFFTISFTCSIGGFPASFSPL